MLKNKFMLKKLAQYIFTSGRGGKRLIVSKVEYNQLKNNNLINITKTGKEYIIHRNHRVWISINEEN